MTMSSGDSYESKEIESIVLKISYELKASVQSGTNHMCVFVFGLVFVIITMILLRDTSYCGLAAAPFTPTFIFCYADFLNFGQARANSPEEK